MAIFDLVSKITLDMEIFVADMSKLGPYVQLNTNELTYNRHVLSYINNVISLPDAFLEELKSDNGTILNDLSLQELYANASHEQSEFIQR